MDKSLEDQVWDTLDQLGEDILQFIRQPSIPNSVYTENQRMYSLLLDDGSHVMFVTQFSKVTK